MSIKTINSNSNSFNEEEGGEINLRELVFKYIRYWKWFIVSVFVFLALGTFVYLCMDRVYEVSTAILLKEDKGSGSPKNSPLSQLEGLGLLSTTNNIDNEIAVFSSPNLMRQIVFSLELYATYFESGFFRNTEVYKDCPYYVKLEGTDIRDLEGLISLKLKKTSEGIQVEGVYTLKKDDTEFDVVLPKLPGYIDMPEGLGKLYVSYRPDAQEDKKEETYYIYVNSVQKATSDLVERIKINPTSKASSVLNINMDVLNVSKGIDILNEIVKTYNTNNVQENNEMAINTAKFVKGRLDTIEVELKEIENAVVNFKKEQGITDISSETKLYLEQTGVIEQKRIEIETQLKTIELVEDFAKSQANKYKMIPNLGITDPGLSNVIANYNSLLLDYEQLERSTNEDSPSRIRVLSNLNATRDAIQSSVNNVKRAMNISKKELEKQSNSISSRVYSVPNQERGLLEIMRQQQTKQALFLYLMQIGEETSITMASTSDKAKVITDPVVPEYPVSPKRNIIILASFLIGLIVPIAVIYIRDLLQININSRDELESLSKVNVIGEIMKKEGDDIIVVQSNNTTPIVELFRTLRNNVSFILDSPEKKVLLVTSTVPGEGKTFVSINLATSFTLSDKKVLLIGMDVRNPKLAADMGFPKGAGLTSYLSGSEPDWESLLVSLRNYPKLDILQAGAIPPNPNELLMKPALEQLLNEARKIYDIILIDSAPIGVVSDTFLLSPLADATIYVTRENVTPKNAVAFINEVYTDNKLPNMYLVINGVDFSKRGRNYKYGYGNTYGYGERK